MGTFGNRVYELTYRHSKDGKDYVHKFGRGARLVARPDGSVAIVQQGGRRRGWDKFGGQVFLTNSPEAVPMARKTPARNSKGRFVKGGARKRSSTKRRRRNPPAAAAPATNPRRKRRRSSAPKARRRSSRRRSSARRNPKLDIVGTLTKGVVGGAEVIVGKALARAVPQLMNLPRQGNVGLAIQGAVATAIGIAADYLLPRGDHAGFLTAGAFSAPMETLAVAYNVPGLAPMLHPVTASAAVGSYMSGRLPPGVSGYIPPAGVGRSRGAGGGRSVASYAQQ